MADKKPDEWKMSSDVRIPFTNDEPKREVTDEVDEFMGMKKVKPIEMQATNKHEENGKLIETRYALSESELQEYRNLTKALAEGINKMNEGITKMQRDQRTLLILVFVVIVAVAIAGWMGIESIRNVLAVGIKVRGF